MITDKDEHQLVLRPKRRPEVCKSNNTLPPRRSARLKVLDARNKYPASLDLAALDEYKAALEAHEEKEKDLFQTCEQLSADCRTRESKYRAAISSVFPDQDFNPDNPDYHERRQLVFDIWFQTWTEGNLMERIKVNIDDREKEAVRWAEIQESLKHGKALHEAAEGSDSMCL